MHLAVLHSKNELSELVVKIGLTSLPVDHLHPEAEYVCLAVQERSATRGLAAVEYLAFDTELFNLKAGKIRMLYYDSETTLAFLLPKLIQELKNKAYRWVSYKCPADDPRQMLALEQHRFRLMTTYVVLEHRQADQWLGPGVSGEESDLRIRFAEERDLADLRRITAQCFDKNTRFHNDPAVDKGKADQMHLLWIEHLLKDPEKKILVGEMKERVSGYIAFGKNRRKAAEGFSRAKIDLMGVARDSRGRGIGNKLLSAFYEQARQHADFFESGTEITNTEALNMYLRAGFSIKEAYYSLHLHL